MSGIAKAKTTLHTVAIYFDGGGDCIFNFIFMDVVVLFVKIHFPMM